MSSFTTRSKLVAVGATCALAGAGAGTVAVAGASTGQSSAHRKGAHAQRAHKGHRHGLLKLAHRTVHGTFVVHTKTGFQTATIDRGTVDSVSGNTLTMTDGTPKASYDKQTLTIPATARVRNDRQKASLSSLTAGERVVVVQLPKRTVVIARPAKAASTSSSAS